MPLESDDVDLTDSHTRTRITHRLKDTGDVDNVAFREHGTDDIKEGQAPGVELSAPALHVYLSTDQITNDVMRVIADEGLSVTPLTPTELLADAGKEEETGGMWGLTPELWAQFVQAYDRFESMSHKEAYHLAKAKVEDETDDAESVDEGLEDIEMMTSIFSVFTSQLTDEQYDALLQLADHISFDDLEEDGIENHVSSLPVDDPGSVGFELLSDGESVEERISAE